MTTNEYVPSEALLRIAWSNYCQSMDACNAWVRPDDVDTRAEFDRFLARVRRDAWDACYHQMVTAPARGVTVIEKSNPYAPERREAP